MEEDGNTRSLSTGQKKRLVLIKSKVEKKSEIWSKDSRVRKENGLPSK